VTSKNTLSAKNLEALGAERLAELLIEISTGNAAAKQRLRLELASQSPGEVAKEVRKRLTTIARSRSFFDWQNRRTLVEDLETQRRAIVDKVAKADPAEGLELIWRFMALANPVFGRCDDSSGTVIGIFHAACRDLGEIAQAAKLAPEVLAERAFSALNENDYGQYDDLIATLSPALGPTGLEQLKERFLELSKAPLEKPKDKDRRVSWGALCADEISSRQRETTIRLALQEIADAQGDVDAFIAQQSEAAKTVPRVAAEIARRLLEANRANEAWKAINTVDENRPGWIPFEWEETRLDVMEVLFGTGIHIHLPLDTLQRAFLLQLQNSNIACAYYPTRTNLVCRHSSTFHGLFQDESGGGGPRHHHGTDHANDKRRHSYWSARPIHP
jgi:hypothetical protein